jgi:hypothetical protein
VKTLRDTAIYEAALSLATFVAGLRGRAPMDAAGASMLALWGPLAERVERELAAVSETANDPRPVTVGGVYDLMMQVRATVTDALLDEETGALQTVEIELERRTFLGGRTVSVDVDEIQLASPV